MRTRGEIVEEKVINKYVCVCVCVCAYVCVCVCVCVFLFIKGCRWVKELQKKVMNKLDQPVPVLRVYPMAKVCSKKDRTF